ncbi:MAG TPA: sigma-70 family RNA polymerase sigma factor [Acidimicrobiales bacterium]|nr:sigma-70 family RNA polymerase sigma factor [Acidimicrobiales bacterium]
MTDLATGRDGDGDRTAPGPPDLERYRTELAGYCYRMLGSSFEADDAVQETMVRAWRGLDRFEGRAALRSWLYRIATNVCFDLLHGRTRRALPMDLGPAGDGGAMTQPLPEATWVEPIPDGRVLPADGDPAERAAARESIRLAFVAALQLLPPRQRAVLILREVLRWRAAEVADLLGRSVPSVNSALQRARATLAGRGADASRHPAALDEAQRDLVDRYIDAFERYDIPRLVALLHEDATTNMPPYPLWWQGPEAIGRWMEGPGRGCRGSRLVQVEANGVPSFAQYRSAGGGRYEPFALHVLDISGDRIAGISDFLDTRLFALFGLPDHLED